VNPTLPTLNISIADDTICTGGSTLINLQSNGTNFNWSPGGSLNDPTSRDVIASPTTTTTYSVTVTRNGCTRIGTATINVLPAPSMSSTQSSGGAAICLDETDVITVTCPDCVSYVWKFPNSSLATTNNVQTVSPNVSGAVQIIISGYDDNGCRGEEIVIVNVDSCFVGTPFSVDEIADTEVQVLNRGSEIEFVSTEHISALHMYNILGEEVLFIQGNRTSVVVSAHEMSSGLYIVRLTTGGEEVIKKIYLK
jgi:hypothetical protein